MTADDKYALVEAIETLLQHENDVQTMLDNTLNVSQILAALVSEDAEDVLLAMAHTLEPSLDIVPMNAKIDITDVNSTKKYVSTQIEERNRAKIQRYRDCSVRAPSTPIRNKSVPASSTPQLNQRHIPGVETTEKQTDSDTTERQVKNAGTKDNGEKKSKHRINWSHPHKNNNLEKFKNAPRWSDHILTADEKKLLQGQEKGSILVRIIQNNLISADLVNYTPSQLLDYKPGILSSNIDLLTSTGPVTSLEMNLVEKAQYYFSIADSNAFRTLQATVISGGIAKTIKADFDNCGSKFYDPFVKEHLTNITWENYCAIKFKRSHDSVTRAIQVNEIVIKYPALLFTSTPLYLLYKKKHIIKLEEEIRKQPKLYTLLECCIQRMFEKKTNHETSSLVNAASSSGDNAASDENFSGKESAQESKPEASKEQWDKITIDNVTLYRSDYNRVKERDWLLDSVIDVIGAYAKCYMPCKDVIIETCLFLPVLNNKSLTDIPSMFRHRKGYKTNSTYLLPISINNAHWYLIVARTPQNGMCIEISVLDGFNQNGNPALETKNATSKLTKLAHKYFTNLRDAPTKIKIKKVAAKMFPVQERKDSWSCGYFIAGVILHYANDATATSVWPIKFNFDANFIEQARTHILQILDEIIDQYPSSTNQQEDIDTGDDIELLEQSNIEQQSEEKATSVQEQKSSEKRKREQEEQRDELQGEEIEGYKKLKKLKKYKRYRPQSDPNERPKQETPSDDASQERKPRRKRI